jgi:hypothetical protein
LPDRLSSGAANSAASCLSAAGSRLESSLANSSSSQGRGGDGTGRFRSESLKRVHRRQRNIIARPPTIAISFAARNVRRRQSVPVPSMINTRTLEGDGTKLPNRDVCCFAGMVDPAAREQLICPTRCFHDFVCANGINPGSCPGLAFARRRFDGRDYEQMRGVFMSDSRRPPRKRI